MGKPGLHMHERSRVQLANQIYTLAIHALKAAFDNGSMVTLENPQRSWLWALLSILVKQLFPDADCDFRTWFFQFGRCGL